MFFKVFELKQVTKNMFLVFELKKVTKKHVFLSFELKNC